MAFLRPPRHLRSISRGICPNLVRYDEAIQRCFLLFGECGFYLLCTLLLIDGVLFRDKFALMHPLSSPLLSSRVSPMLRCSQVTTMSTAAGRRSSRTNTPSPTSRSRVALAMSRFASLPPSCLLRRGVIRTLSLLAPTTGMETRLVHVHNK